MKQTAVEWLIQKLRGCDDKGNFIFNGVINSELINQAKEMENEQHQETFKQSRQAKIFEKDMPPVWESWEQYYNQTYKK